MVTPTSRIRRRPLVPSSFEESADGADVCLVFHGKRLTMPARARPVLEAVVQATGVFTPQSLAGDLDDESRVVLMRRLVREGFLTLAP
jgi:bifunctional lysine-specific demethylase and histidyl-hydroxylase NO66